MKYKISKIAIRRVETFLNNWNDLENKSKIAM